VPSTELATLKSGLENFLFFEVYRHESIRGPRESARRSLQELFALFSSRPELMPLKFQQRVATDGLPRAISDYLAGMTDRFALDEHRRLTAI
jgi:dGTPase